MFSTLVSPRENSENNFICKLIEYKLVVSLIITGLILFVQICELIFTKEERVIRAWTKRFLRFIAKEQLGGGEYHTRISILRPQKGWQFIIQYLYFVFDSLHIDTIFQYFKKVLT